MKKIIPVFLVLVLTLGLFSCGSASISGESTTYTNAAGSVSIDLPGKWTADEEASDDTLDITYSNGAAQVKLQCLAKGQIDYLAKDLNAYADYSMVNTLGDYLADAEMADTEISVPDFIKDSKAQSFTLQNGGDTVKGFVVFMESARCYYTCIAMATGEVYDASGDKLMESVLSIKELAEIPSEEGTDE